MNPTIRLTCAAALGLALAAPAAAEDFTADQLRALFEAQKDAVSAAQASGLGQTRGLKLITTEDANAPAADAGATLGTTDTAAVASVSGADTSLDPNAPIVPVSFEEKIRINYQIKFDYDSAALSAAEQANLQPMCEAIASSDVQVLRIVGHTDAAGSDAYNQRLSQLRAEEVARHLVEECGIAPERLQTLGMGESDPANPDNPRADENRRVEFQALG